LFRKNIFKSSIPVTLWARASCIIVFGAVDIWTVVESSVTFPYWPSTSLIQVMPAETSEWTVVRTSTLEKIWTLLCTKLLKISGKVQQNRPLDTMTEREDYHIGTAQCTTSAE